jgi:hypothetical protein
MKKVFVNTSDSLNGSHRSKIRTHMNGMVRDKKNILYTTICLIHAEFPVSFYIINEYSNKLHINGVDVYIEHGNYNANTFLSYFNTLSYGEMSVSNSTGKFIITGTVHISHSLSTIGNIMGFDRDITSVNNVLIMPFPCNFSNVKNILIKSDNLILNNYSQTGDSSIISSIQKNVPHYSTIYYNNFAPTGQLIRNVTLDYLDIDICDDKGRLINFNNLVSYLTFEIISYTKFSSEKMTLHEMTLKNTNVRDKIDDENK